MRVRERLNERGVATVRGELIGQKRSSRQQGGSPDRQTGLGAATNNCVPPEEHVRLHHVLRLTNRDDFDHFSHAQGENANFYNRSHQHKESVALITNRRANHSLHASGRGADNPQLAHLTKHERRLTTSLDQPILACRKP
jgi:hypothetical protein